MGPNGPHCNSKFLGEKFSRVSQKQNKNKTKQIRTEQNKRGSSPAGEEGGGAGVEEPEGPGEGEVDRGGLAPFHDPQVRWHVGWSRAAAGLVGIHAATAVPSASLLFESCVVYRVEIGVRAAKVHCKRKGV